MTLEMPPPLAMYWSYLGAVREAISHQPDEWVFRSDPQYRMVLEHTPVEFAEAMLKWSMNALPGLDLDDVRTIATLCDSVGKPEQNPIPGFGTFAPSNMRYLCHAIKMWQHIDSLGLPEVDVVEIGGGFGGLALYVDRLRRYFTTDLVGYTVLDLPDVAKLINKVFGVWDLPDSFGAHRGEVGLYGLWPTGYCFSAYAFSEFDQPTRDWYAERVLRHCPHGMVIWNFPVEKMLGDDGRMFGGPPYQFVDWPITRVPDEPPLYDLHEMITW